MRIRIIFHPPFQTIFPCAPAHGPVTDTVRCRSDTVNGKYTALLQKETKTATDDSNAVTANGLASSPLDLVNTASENSGVETTAYTYDANGNQITKVTDEKTETNTYDGLNQLIGFTDGETTASHTYNADGLRTSKTVDGETINHIWDGNKQIVVDMDDSDWYSAEVYVRGTNLLAKFSKQSGNVKTDYQYYTQNAHGDVVNLTDADGAIAKSYTYDAFGVEQNIDDADSNAFRYCGGYFDSETGTIYLRARYYNPTTGRFISRDSFAGKNEDPLSLNLYTYCNNNPIIYADSTGNSPSLIIAGIVFTATDIILMTSIAVLAALAICSTTPSGRQAISDASTAVGGVVGDVGETVGEWRNSASNWWSKNSDAIKAIIAAGATSVIKSAVESSATSDNQKKDTKYYIYVLWEYVENESGGFDKVVQYVGQTVNPERRKSEHSKNVARAGLHFDLVDGMVFDSKWDARMAEQAGIEYFNTLNRCKGAENKKNNQRNEISQFNLKYYTNYLSNKAILTN